MPPPAPSAAHPGLLLGSAPIGERLVCYCRTTSASTAPYTSRRMCCPTHCVLVTVPRASRACQHFPDGFDLHLLQLIGEESRPAACPRWGILSLTLLARTHTLYSFAVTEPRSPPPSRLVRPLALSLNHAPTNSRLRRFPPHALQRAEEHRRSTFGCSMKLLSPESPAYPPTLLSSAVRRPFTPRLQPRDSILLASAHPPHQSSSSSSLLLSRLELSDTTIYEP